MQKSVLFKKNQKILQGVTAGSLPLHPHPLFPSAVHSFSLAQRKRTKRDIHPNPNLSPILERLN